MEIETIETQACSGTVAGATRVKLCRMVFDAMLERDLVGVLLSPKHFRLFLTCLARHAPTDCSTLHNRSRWMRRHRANFIT